MNAQQQIEQQTYRLLGAAVRADEPQVFVQVVRRSRAVYEVQACENQTGTRRVLTLITGRKQEIFSALSERAPTLTAEAVAFGRQGREWARQRADQVHTMTTLVCRKLLAWSDRAGPSYDYDGPTPVHMVLTPPGIHWNGGLNHHHLPPRGEILPDHFTSGLTWDDDLRDWPGLEAQLWEQGYWPAYFAALRALCHGDDYRVHSALPITRLRAAYTALGGEGLDEELKHV